MPHLGFLLAPTLSLSLSLSHTLIDKQISLHTLINNYTKMLQRAYNLDSGDDSASGLGNSKISMWSILDRIKSYGT